MGIIIRTTSPVFSPADDLRAFENLVGHAGEVTPQGLAGRIAAAESLAFAREDQRLVGVGALKLPATAYTLKVFEKAGVPGDAKSHDLELGWIAVIEEYRGQGIGASICRKLIAPLGSRPVFSTTRSDNENMRRILAGIGFSQHGHLFESSEHPGSLIALLVRG